MKKIISFSLYGDEMKYWMGAIENIKLAAKYYKGWKCRFYISSESDTSLINRIVKEDCETIIVKADQPHSGLFWRFYAADDSDIMICRDTDSRLSEREATAVKYWLQTKKRFHIMRDHPLHNALIPGGMWGSRCIEGMRDLINSFPYQDAKGTDQLFLAQYIYPQIKEDAIIHDSYNLFSDSINFPTGRILKEFVGCVYDQNNNIVV